MADLQWACTCGSMTMVAFNGVHIWSYIHIGVKWLHIGRYEIVNRARAVIQSGIGQFHLVVQIQPKLPLEVRGSPSFPPPKNAFHFFSVLPNGVNHFSAISQCSEGTLRPIYSRNNSQQLYGAENFAWVGPCLVSCFFIKHNKGRFYLPFSWLSLYVPSCRVHINQCVHT